MASTVEKPKKLTNPRRAFVKKTGKKLVRKIASFQTKQSTVPDTPKIENSYFPFLKEFTDNCLLYTSPSPRDATLSRMPSSA